MNGPFCDGSFCEWVLMWLGPFVLGCYVMGPFVMGPLVMGPYVGTPHIYLSPQIISTCHLMPVQGEGGICSPYMISPRISLIGTLLYVQSKRMDRIEGT